MDTTATSDYLESSLPALKHLFEALEDYNRFLAQANKEIEKLNSLKTKLNVQFESEDQWSDNANFYFRQLSQRTKHLDHLPDLESRLRPALYGVGATLESMACLAGAILQIAKTILSLHHAGKPIIASVKQVGSQSIVDVIWEGRNHAMHWEEVTPGPKVQAMFKALKVDFELEYRSNTNHCLEILQCLGWTSSNVVANDLKGLI